MSRHVLRVDRPHPCACLHHRGSGVPGELRRLERWLHREGPVSIYDKATGKILGELRPPS